MNLYPKKPVARKVQSWRPSPLACSIIHRFRGHGRKKLSRTDAIEALIRQAALSTGLLTRSERQLVLSENGQSS